MTSKDMNLNLPRRMPAQPRDRKAPIGAQTRRKPRPALAAAQPGPDWREPERVAGGAEVRE